MREWIIRPGDPTALTLAADARLIPTDYCNDQIWELVVGRGEPPALTLQTTFGLRARSLRIFPRFAEKNQPIFSDPAAFASPVRLLNYYPNALRLAFQPLPDIETHLQYWLPNSQTAAGQITLTNHSSRARQVQVEWVAMLAPGASGQRMAAVEIEAAQVLAGQTQDLAPVFFITGGAVPGSGSYPCLLLTIDLAPQESQTITWAHVALNDINASFSQARQIATRHWEAEIARIEMINASQVEIRTGDQDWDRALSLSQTIAYTLFVGPTPALPYPSIVLTRQPDQGFSLRGDGSDYNHLWSGQPAFEIHSLSHLLLPTSPDLLKGLLRNYLFTQAENGAIDWKPGLGQQRSQVNATPLLAGIAWRIYHYTRERAFLEEIFPGLHRFFTSWFIAQRDRDQDGIPEWINASQTGFDDHPFFTHWHRWARGVDPTTVESPDLCSYLYCECTTLIRIARLIQREDVIDALQATAKNLRAAVESSWKDADASYHYRDRETHTSPGRLFALALTWPGEPNLPQHFAQPVRLLVRLTTPDGASRRAQVFLHGSSASGAHQVEPLNAENFRWFMGCGNATSQRTYIDLDHIEVQGLEPGDTLEIQNIDYLELDQTLLLPLWAGIPTPERAKVLLNRTILDPERFWRAYGVRSNLPTGAAGSQPANGSAEQPSIVYPAWNALLIEGLLAYGFRSQAAELMSRLMNLAAQSLKREGAFRMSYFADSGSGSGERGALHGLAPVNLFLQVLGINILNAQQIVIQGFNPFPWPVTVKYQGTTILCQKDKATVIFPDGQTSTVTDAGPLMVSMDRSVVS